MLLGGWEGKGDRDKEEEEEWEEEGDRETGRKREVGI